MQQKTIQVNKNIKKGNGSFISGLLNSYKAFRSKPIDPSAHINFQKLIMQKERARYSFGVGNNVPLVMNKLKEVISPEEITKLNGSTIIVVGFGSEWQELESMKKIFPDSKIVGVDWLSKNIQEAQENIDDSNIEFVNEDIRNLPESYFKNVGMIYSSYLLDARLFNHDESELSSVIRSIKDNMQSNTLLVSMPAFAISCDSEGLKALHNDHSGLHSIFIGKKK